MGSSSTSRSLDAFSDTIDLNRRPIQEWDGAAKDSYGWKGLHRDPVLWTRHGNCLVYLYAKGRSRQGPSFRIPFQSLLDKNCAPLIRRFLVVDGATTAAAQLGADPQPTAELYIPSPPGLSSRQAFTYHVATRNFFAWLQGRPVVGEHLGPALVGLFHAMREFRGGVGVDNAADLMAYMDEEGYLDVAHRPTYAVAMLHVAEAFRLRDLYIRAFAHCVGMSDVLGSCPEYATLSRATRKLIGSSRSDLQSRVSAAYGMLDDFLDDAMSESRLGIPPAARAHLQQFRRFIEAHYASRLGRHPASHLDPQLCRLMCRDFECLYRLLVDQSYSTSQGMPWVASNGICMLQLVDMFDREHQLEPLEHPLPHMPTYTEGEGDGKATPRYVMRWLGDDGRKRKPNRRLLAHAALIKASNWKDRAISDNELVKAYRMFEEESVLSSTVSRMARKDQQVSVSDARKVRWILIYAIYQVLRSITVTPPEAFDAARTEYHMAVSTENLPPWDETEKMMAEPPERDCVDQTGAGGGGPAPAPSVYWADGAAGDVPSPQGLGRIEIKPDIDYYALTHRDSRSPVESNPDGLLSPTSVAAPKRQGSVSRALRRNSTVRRSIRLFRPSSMLLQSNGTDLSHSNSSSSTGSRSNGHGEILVGGYGNGLNHVRPGSKHGQTTPVKKAASRNSSTGSCVSMPSPGSTQSDDTLESSICSLTMTGDDEDEDDDDDIITTEIYTLPPPPRTETTSKPSWNQRRSVLPTPTRRASMAVSASALRRPVSTMLSRSNSTRGHSSGGGNNNNNNNSSSSSSRLADPFDPLIMKGRQGLEDDWMAMQAFMDGQCSPHVDGTFDCDDGDVKPAWEQYNDLGGLTETRC